MTGEASAYAVLGLDPGADSAEIEQAYRRLIKRHHPDRQGGDARRAADINRAYDELSRLRDLKTPLELSEAWSVRPRRRRGWLLVSMLLVLAASGLLFSSNALAPDRLLQSVAHAPSLVRTRVKDAPHTDAMEKPLDVAAIDASANDALHLSRTGDEMAMASASRDCHRLLRSNPSLAQLDRCAAFDDAVVQLQDRDPMRDQGPFSELSVTGRQWSGATELSEDSMAIQGRLDRIRMQVEFALASSPATAFPTDG